MPRPGRALWASAALAAVLPLAGCGDDGRGEDGGGQAPAAYVTVHDGDGLHGVVLSTPYTVPDVTLTDTAGEPYSPARDASAPLTLVFFGYTSCPDVCRLVMADVASALNRLSPGDREDVAMLFVTSDPARDDPATLRRYLDRYDPSFEGLTGPLPAVVRLGDALGVPVERGARLPTGGYEVGHGTQVLALTPDGTAPVVWTMGTPAADLAEDLTTVLHGGVPRLRSAS